MDSSFVRSVQLVPADDSEERVGYPWELASVHALADGLVLHPKVTYLVGENGSGKSTLLEAPIVLAYPNATIYECSETGVDEIRYEEAPAVKLTTGFLAARERYLDQLLGS